MQVIIPKMNHLLNQQNLIYKKIKSIKYQMFSYATMLTTTCLLVAVVANLCFNSGNYSNEILKSPMNSIVTITSAIAGSAPISSIVTYILFRPELLPQNRHLDTLTTVIKYQMSL